MNLWNKMVRLGRTLVNPVRNTAQTFINQFSMLFGNTSKPTMYKLNRENLRLFSRSAIPRRAIELIKDGVLKLPYKITSKDGNDHTAEIAIVNNILSKPNNIDSYRTFFSQILEDVLVLDAGTFEKAKSGDKSHPLFLFPIDGSTMECVMAWQGNPKEERYAQFINGNRQYYLDSQVAYLKKVIVNDSPFGLSPLETAFKYINYLLNTQEYANDIASNALPKFLTTVGKEITPEQLNAFRSYISNDIQGQSALPLLNTDTLESKQCSPIGDEALYLQWQRLLVQIIACAFGVPAEKLGITIANDKDTTQGKSSEFLEDTIKPYALMLQEAIQHHIIEALGYGDIIQFEYTFTPTLEQKKTMTDIVRNLYITDVIKRSEARLILSQVFSEINVKATDVSGDMYITEYKTKENIELAKANAESNGGFNGSGASKDNFDNKVTDSKIKGG